MHIDGEKWVQAEKLVGSFRVKSHDPSGIELKDISLILAYGTFKKVKAKDPKAFDIVERISLAESDKIAGEEQEFNWEISLAADCKVTENRASLYLLYGSGDDLANYGHLQLLVGLPPVQESLVEVIKTFYRFSLKQMTNKKGFVDLKMIPPETTEFNKMKQLNLGLRKVDQNLEIIYEFSMNKFASGVVGVKIKTEKKKITRTLTPDQFEIGRGMPNQAVLRSSFGDVLAEIRTTAII